MSFQFGTWYFVGPRPLADVLSAVGDIASCHAPDGLSSYKNDGLSVLFGAFQTTKEAGREKQPLCTRTGAVVTWNGRLDNRTELLTQLGEPLSWDAADVELVANAYERWGTDAFSKLLGDWVLSVWDPRMRKLLLAKDVIGVRHLHWHIARDHVTWSTALDAIVRAEKFSPILEEEYLAGWFSHYPAPHLTPFCAVRSVSPGSLVSIGAGQYTIRQLGAIKIQERIHYRNDREYEEQFRDLFVQSIRRRLRSQHPVLAELSGGVDSSSIVCVADRLIADGEAEAPRLDTVSFYDPSEASWDERPYFTKVEQARRRIGCHIDVGGTSRWIPGLDCPATGLTPGACVRQCTESALAECLKLNGNRVVLSGLGGDEMMGGVPTAIPELADLLAAGHLYRLAQQITRWAMAQKESGFHLLLALLRAFLPPRSAVAASSVSALEWLRADFIRRHREVLSGYECRLRLFGQRPSIQENVAALRALQRQLECSGPRTTFPHEVRYPYLDKDLLEFLFAVPREQMIRPGQRRSLMRRALMGIVPEEVLQRKRKAFILRAPMVAIADHWMPLDQMTRHMVSDEMGIVNGKKFRDVLSRVRDGHVVPMVPVIRTLLIEHWLRGVTQPSLIEAMRTHIPRPAPSPQSALSTGTS